MSTKILNDYLQLCKLSGIKPSNEGLEVYNEVEKNRKLYNGKFSNKCKN